MNKLKKLMNVIDWNKFEEKETLLRSKVTIYCSICIKPRHVTVDSLYRRSLKGNQYVCPKCGSAIALKKPETMAKIKKGNMERAKSKAHRAALSEGQRRRFNDYKQRRIMARSLKEKWEDDALRENASKKAKERWEDEEWRKKYLESDAVIKKFEKQRLPENRKAASDRTKELWKDPEYVKKIEAKREETIAKIAAKRALQPKVSSLEKNL